MIRTFNLPLLAMAILGCAWIAGCASDRDQQAPTSSASQVGHKVPIDISVAQKDLDKFIDTLRTIRGSNSSDNLGNAYSDLKSQAQNLKQALADVLAKGDAAVAAGNDQIAKWRNQSDQFTDPDLRTASNRRQSDLRHAVDALASSDGELKTSSDAFRQQIDQTLKALGFDLSPAGVKSIDPASDKIIHDAPGIRSDLQDVATRSSDMSRTINS